MQKQSSISPFIIKKIKSTSWENRSYINDLLKIRNWIKNGCDEINEGFYYKQLINRYPLEYIELFKELNLVLKAA